MEINGIQINGKLSDNTMYTVQSNQNTHPDNEGESILLEWQEVERELISSLRHRHEIPGKLEELVFSLEHFDITRLGNRPEVFLSF